MSWLQQFDDTFNRANGSPGNGWVDASTSNFWAIASAVLTSASNAFSTNILSRPAGESLGDQRVVMKSTPVLVSAGKYDHPLIWLRLSGKSGYVCWLGDNAQLEIARSDNGSLFRPTGAAVSASIFSQLGSGDVITTFDIVGNVLNASIALASAPGTPLATATWSDSTYSAGVQGISPLASPNNVKEFTVYSSDSASVGALSLTGNDLTGVTVGATIGSGAAPYALALYRSPTVPFTPPAAGMLVASANQSGTAVSLKDTAPGSADAFYRLVVTDAASSSATSVQSANQGALPVKPKQKAYVLGFIGDSITYGQGASGGSTTAVTVCTNNLTTLEQGAAVSSNNQGISGTTTADWAAGGTDLANAITAFTAAGVTHVLIQLGTNDAKVAVATPASTYASRLAATAAQLVAAGFKVVLNAPPYVVPGSSSGQWNEASLSLLAAYRDAIPGVCNGTTVLKGESNAFDYFLNHTSQLTDGIHPNDTGHAALASLWSTAFEQAVNGGAGASPGFYAY